MIVNSLADLFIDLVMSVFSFVDMVGLPIQYINVLQSILSYGVWVVGIDVMSIFSATIVGWWGVKFVVGLFIFIWELFPFT